MTGDPSTRETKQQVFDALLAAYNKGASASYRYVISGGYIHILPDKVLGPDGKFHVVASLLDTRVTLNRSEYTLGTLVSSVINQVSQAAGTSVMDGTFPSNLYRQARVTEEAKMEPAREVLIRAFEKINPPRVAMALPGLRLTWDLVYNPMDRQYFFSVYPAPEESVPGK